MGILRDLPIVYDHETATLQNCFIPNHRRAITTTGYPGVNQEDSGITSTRNPGKAPSRTLHSVYLESDGGFHSAQW